MEYPNEYKYTKDHEWIFVQGDTATVGITDFAQSELGEIVFAELPKVGKAVKAGDPFCVVESTKAASDVYAPIAGTVKEVNGTLTANPGLLNSEPHTEAWMAKLTGFSSAELGGLLDAAAYRKLIGK